MDLVLVGLPGSGKSVVGKRLAHRHGAAFIDLDERIEREDGRPIPRIFEEDGEAAFRRHGAARRRRTSGRPDPDAGAPAHHRDRRRRGRRSAQPLGAVPRPAERLARQPAGGPRPAAATLPACPAARRGTRPDRHAPRPRRRGASASTPRPTSRDAASPRSRRSWRAVERHLAERARTTGDGDPTTLLRAATPIGRIILGEGIAAGGRRRDPAPARGAAGDPRLGARGLGGGRRAPRRGARRGRAGRSRR